MGHGLPHLDAPLPDDEEATYKLCCFWLILIYMLPLYKNPQEPCCACASVVEVLILDLLGLLTGIPENGNFYLFNRSV